MSLRVFIPLFLLLGACSDPVTPPADEQSANIDTQTSTIEDDATASQSTDIDDTPIALLYRCDDGLEFTALLNDHKVSLTLAQEVIELHQQPAAAGLFFKGENWQLHSKNREALLINDELTRECYEVQQQTPLTSGP